MRYLCLLKKIIRVLTSTLDIERKEVAKVSEQNAIAQVSETILVVTIDL